MAYFHARKADKQVVLTVSLHRYINSTPLHTDTQNSLDSLGTAWHYVNLPLQYMYIALLLLCFLLSLGNRPAG